MTRAPLTPIAVLLVLGLAQPGLAADSDARRATIADGVDRTVSYDIASVHAKLEPGANRLTIRVMLHRPFPVTAGRDFGFGAVSVSANGPPSNPNDCRTASARAGTVSMILAPKVQTPTPAQPEIHVANVTVRFRQTPIELPVAFSPDRRTATVVVQDNLLRRADLRCLSARGTGRAATDPTQPFGGPVSDDPKSVFFAGFSPAARLRRALVSCTRRFDGRRRRLCRQRARARFS